MLRAGHPSRVSRTHPSAPLTKLSRFGGSLTQQGPAETGGALLGIFVHKKGEGVVRPHPRPVCLRSDALLQLCQHPLKLLRPGAGELHGPAGTGMEKAQARGVETLARQTRHGLLIAVHLSLIHISEPTRRS